MDYEKLTGTHDLSVPDWGPFTKKYFGISHITDRKLGLRFDFSVIPGYYRTKPIIPNVLKECGVHPWETTGDYSYYSYRYDMEWKDKLICDVSYIMYDEDVRLVRCEFINNTYENQNTTLNFIGFLDPPLVSLNDKNTMVYAYPELPLNAVFIDGIDYESLEYKTSRPTDNLIFGGLYRGEQRASGFVNGRALADGFGNEAGDRVKYKFNIKNDIKNACLMIRYKAGQTNIFELKGSVSTNIILPKTDEIRLEKFEIGSLNSGENEIEIIAKGAGGLMIDGFVIIDTKNSDSVSFSLKDWDLVPRLTQNDNNVIMEYKDTDICYGMKWDSEKYMLREYMTDNLEPIFTRTASGLSRTKYDEGGKVHYTNAYMYPFYLKPRETKVIYGFVTCGAKEDVLNKLEALEFNQEKLEAIYNDKRGKRVKYDINKYGKQFENGVSLMNAMLQSNVVFPIYVHGSYIRHNTPGKWWDCLYTWDSGFISLALNYIDKERTIENINAYMTKVGFTHAAFVHFGSPVPVQFYAFLELYNKYGDIELAKYFYPKLKQYYEFLSGKSVSSRTNSLKSDLLKTWDYFYNSGGWDDYPPQVYVHKNNLTKNVTAICTNCHVIRCAKILSMLAMEIGMDSDADEYSADIKRFSDAVLDNAWDEESGYFGYVVHDENNKPKDILRYSDGQNFNRGLDGAYPLVAGIADKHQKNKILENLKSEDHLWTKIGLSTVDINAPYFDESGYWNGAVWMAHQWFYYKTMLDLGEREFARKIALTALNLWEKETSLTYNCYEHFLVKSGRGAGWHNFSALSAPVVNWFNYYFVKGNFTTGFDVLVKNSIFKNDYKEFSADIKTYGNDGELSAVITLNENCDYNFKLNDKKLKAFKIYNGVYEIIIPKKMSGCLKAEVI